MCIEGRRMGDRARTVEGHAERALVYQTDGSVLKRRDIGITGGFCAGDE